MKCNLGPRADDVSLRWTNGAFIPEHEPGGLVGAIQASAVERDFLEALDKLAEQGKHVTDAPNSPRYAPRVMRKTLALSHSKRALETAMNSLFRSGAIVNGAAKRPNRHTAVAIVRKPENGSNEVR